MSILCLRVFAMESPPPVSRVSCNSAYKVDCFLSTLAKKNNSSGAGLPEISPAHWCSLQAAAPALKE